MLFTLTNVITSPILRSIPNSVTIILKVSFTVDGVSFCCCACTGIKEEEEELTVADSISRDVKVRKIIILLVLFRKVVAVVTIVIVIIKSPKIT
jgi:hypothetical protein